MKPVINKPSEKTSTFESKSPLLNSVKWGSAWTNGSMRDKITASNPKAIVRHMLMTVFMMLVDSFMIGAIFEVGKTKGRNASSIDLQFDNVKLRYYYA